ncbi:hypothetical protein BB559_005330 [Furculomyces boomerangus]|nr:hypothetical protein BB559_005330 [Furculomyces boomerangus]
MATFISKSLEVFSLFFIRTKLTNVFAPGPFGLIAAGVIEYYSVVPSSFKTKLFGFMVSDKAFTYLLLAQLGFIQFPFTIIPLISGMIAGSMYSNNVADIQFWRFPNILNKSFAHVFGNILFSGPLSPRGTETLPQLNNGQRSGFSIGLDSLNRNNQTQNETQQTNMRPVAPSGNNTGQSIPQDDITVEENILQLQAMFPDSSRERIIIALQSSNYDPNRAASNLLEFP